MGIPFRELQHCNTAQNIPYPKKYSVKLRETDALVEEKNLPS